MRQSRFLFSAGRAALFTALFLFTAALFFPLCRCAAQTTQPYLFAATNDSSTNTTTGFVTLLRDSTTGALTMPPNTSVSFKDTCSPTIIDPTGNYLFSVCGQGVAMYTLEYGWFHSHNCLAHLFVAVQRSDSCNCASHGRRYELRKQSYDHGRL
jgi:hypothetical protein